MKQPAYGALLAGALVLLQPPAPGRAAVLLGVEWLQRGASDWEPAPQRLRTYWITGYASGARVERTIEGLVLPQSRGFKRLSIKRTCKTDREDPNRPLDRCEDEYAVAALNTRMSASMTGSYEPDGPCSYRVARIDFASPLAVALRTWHGNSEGCEPRGYHWSEYAWVQPVEAKGEAITVDSVTDTSHIRLSSLLGGTAVNAYASAIEKALAKAKKEEELECVADPDADDRWTLFRERGQWRARTFQAEFPPCDLVYDIAVALPSKLTGPDRLAIPWALLVTAVPDVVDAVSSPDGAWTLVVTRSQLLFVSGRDLSRKTVLSSLLEREHASSSDPAVRLITAQWAVGDPNVTRWSGALASAR